MDELIIEGVRCFRERQEVPLRPITLLIGENSTGKTTFLAMARLAWDICHARPSLDFNEEPFLLGAFDDLAAAGRGRSGQANAFTVGLRVLPNEEITNAITVAACFVGGNTQPEMKQWRVESGELSLEMGFGRNWTSPNVTVRTPSGQIHLTRPHFPEGVPPSTVFPFLDFILSPGMTYAERPEVRGERPTPEEVRMLSALGPSLSQSIGARPYAIAPIRTRPKRTYDPTSDAPEPEGGHVPMILAKISSVDPKGWRKLTAALGKFGIDSGLFRDLEVRRLGKGAAAPFQIQIKISTSAFNLVDVGYGVSQVLPIIVDALRGTPERTYLLQQPEVHLHPKAQAELGSFLAYLAKQQRKRFLVETHSDYLMDRIRMEVRDGKHGLKPEDVSLLFFERKRGEVTIHRLEIDCAGNILNPPRGYRKFFLDEQWRLIGG